MIFTNATGGRTGNQLVIMTHLIASSLEHNIAFFNFGLTPEKHFNIKQTRKQFSYSIPLLAKIIGKIITTPFTLRLLKKSGIQLLRNSVARADEYVPDIRQAAQSLRPLILGIWPYTDYAALYKHQEECRRFISPKNTYISAAEKVLHDLKATGHPLVGVHIRRTDYKTWFRGKYYYDTAVYEKAMCDIVKLFPNGVRFVVCSDEKFSAADFPSLPEDCLYFSENSFVTDFVLLASCDYLIGPPSTFSGYASFYGKAKKCTLFSPHQTINSLDDFGVVMIDYDDITEHITKDGDIHREYIKLSEGRVVSKSVPTLPL